MFFSPLSVIVFNFPQLKKWLRSTSGACCLNDPNDIRNFPADKWFYLRARYPIRETFNKLATHLFEWRAAWLQSIQKLASNFYWVGQNVRHPRRKPPGTCLYVSLLMQLFQLNTLCSVKWGWLWMINWGIVEESVKVLSQYMPRQTEENREESQSGQKVSDRESNSGPP